MVVISVVAGVMVYSWVSGFISTAVPRTPEVYAVSITDVTVYNVSSGISPTYNVSTTTLKVTVRNPEAKDIVIDNSNIKIKESDGDEIIYTSGVTSFIVYNMSTSYGAGQLNDSLILNMPNNLLTSNTNKTVTLIGGRSTTFYVQIANATAYNPAYSGVLSGALTKGNAYTITLVEAATYDGIPVAANEKTFKATK